MKSLDVAEKQEARYSATCAQLLPDATFAQPEVLTSANRFSMIHRVNVVKRVETRERKIQEFVAMLARHETPYPQKAKPVE